MADKTLTSAMLRMSADLRIAIDTEGRMPEVVMLVFAEPTSKDETAVRVNEYVRNERTERIIDAVASATAPEVSRDDTPTVDPYAPTRRRRVSRPKKKPAKMTGGERGSVES